MKVKGYFIYPTLLRAVGTDPYRGVIIRVTNKKGTSIDIECYDDSRDRVRIKAQTDHWLNGKITAGYSTEIIDRFNSCIHRVQGKIESYVRSNPHLNKPLMMEFIYGAQLATAKKKRTKYVTIPVSHSGRVLDSIDLTNNEVVELLKPHLSKQTFANSDGKEKTIEGIFDSETSESMIQSVDDYHEIVVHEKSNKDHADKIKADNERINQMPTAERYKKGYFNKLDICELFALTYFDEKITNEFYSKIVVRLFEYKERTQVSTHIKDFNLVWIKKYFDWFEENGWYPINTKTFDPLKYKKEMFFANKPRKPYKGSLTEKNVNMLKQITNKFIKLGYLKPIQRLDDFDFKEFTKKQSRKGTRKEFAFQKD